jgi:hypothetical protein
MGTYSFKTLTYTHIPKIERIFYNTWDMYVEYIKMYIDMHRVYKVKYQGDLKCTNVCNHI